MKRGTGFIQYIKHWGVFFLIFLFFVIGMFDVIYTFGGLEKRETALREEYDTKQRATVKSEVSSVVNLLNYEYSSREDEAKKLVREHVAAACALAENIYAHNKDTKSPAEIQALIIEALRPIRFSKGSGYYFIIDLRGKEILNAGRADLEGNDMLKVQDSGGKYIVRDMIDIAKKQGEGFCTYQWAKPKEAGNNFSKLSFVKLFKPYSWVIGTGMYFEDVSDQLGQFIKDFVRTHRFGSEKNGYVFVYKLLDLNGGNRFAIMYANPNRPDLEGTYLSDTYTDTAGKAFRREMLAGLRKEGEVFVRYQYKKMSTGKQSPKLSFFKLAAGGRYIVGAGVYLDDGKKESARLKRLLLRQTVEKLGIGSIIIFVVALLFLFFIRRFIKRLKKDIALFISFFDQAVHTGKPITIREIRFKEFRILAESANTMLREKTAAEKSLVESEKNYRNLSRLKNEILESARGIIVYALDRNYCYKDFTQLHREMMKKFKGADIEIGGNKLSYIKDEEERRQRKSYFDRALGGESFVFYEEYSDVPPAVTYFENHYSPILDEAGNIIGLSAYVIDITELKRIQGELEESRERFKNLSQLTFEGILIHRKGVVMDVNESLLRITGYQRDELLGKDVISLFVPEAYHEKIRQEMVKPVTKPYEIMGRRKDGTLIPLEIEARNVKSKMEDFRVTAVRDITERKKIEEEHIKLSKLESLGVLAGGIAHDFNNILTGIFGNLELAQVEVPPNHPSYVYLGRARDAIGRATRLTKQLLTFSRGGEPVREEVDLAAVVQEVAEFTLSGSNVKVQFRIADGLGSVSADKGQLGQVVTNLVLNAKQAMPEGGNLSITLDTTVEAGRPFVSMCVSDEGPGIPPDLLKKIFDPFFTTKATGNGLGLATVFSIVKKHGGHITVDSETGRGAAFTVYLPRKNSLSVRRNVLVVDDEEMVRDIVSAMLDSLGYHGDTACDGEEAVRKYSDAYRRGEAYAAVIVDLAIPGGMGGGEVVQKLLDIDPSAYVIASKEYSRGSPVVDYGKYGFSGVITKPFRYKDLERELSSIGIREL